jgi:hypothetical protein
MKINKPFDCRLCAAMDIAQGALHARNLAFEGTYVLSQTTHTKLCFVGCNVTTAKTKNSASETATYNIKFAAPQRCFAGHLFFSEVMPGTRVASDLLFLRGKILFSFGRKMQPNRTCSLFLRALGPPRHAHFRFTLSPIGGSISYSFLHYSLFLCD